MSGQQPADTQRIKDKLVSTWFRAASWLKAVNHCLLMELIAQELTLHFCIPGDGGTGDGLFCLNIHPVTWGQQREGTRKRSMFAQGKCSLRKYKTVLGLPLHWSPKTKRACGTRATVRTEQCQEITLAQPQLGKSRPRGRRGPQSGSRGAGWAGPGCVSVGLGLALSWTGSESQRPHLG